MRLPTGRVNDVHPWRNGIPACGRTLRSLRKRCKLNWWKQSKGLAWRSQIANYRNMSRSVAAMLIGLLGITAYVILVMILGDWVLEMHWTVQFLYFAAAGILWVFPAKRLIYWSAGK
jgi:hypothetical protein